MASSEFAELLHQLAQLGLTHRRCCRLFCAIGGALLCAAQICSICLPTASTHLRHVFIARRKTRPLASCPLRHGAWPAGRAFIRLPRVEVALICLFRSAGRLAANLFGSHPPPRLGLELDSLGPVRLSFPPADTALPVPVRHQANALI